MSALAAVLEEQAKPALNDFPPGIVVVPCHDQARWHQFTLDLTMLDVPDKTEIMFQRSVSVVQNLNFAIETMMDGDAAWAWIIGDDHSFKRDLVHSLLIHDLDIVAPVCTKRGPPFQLVVMDKEVGEDEQGRTMYNVVKFDELPLDGKPFEVAACGTAGMLIKRRVFEELGSPWFRNSDGVTVNEDMEFCKRVREAGFKVMVDPESTIGHIGMVTAWPAFRDGVWGLVLDFQNEAQIWRKPQADPGGAWMPGGAKPARVP